MDERGFWLKIAILRDREKELLKFLIIKTFCRFLINEFTDFATKF